MHNGAPFNVYTTRVRSYLTDLSAVMYHGAYLDVFDDARIETFRNLGYTYQDVLEEGWVLVIRRATCEYFMPARMDDLLTITVHVPKLTRATMTAEYHCCRGADLLAHGTTVYAFIDSAGKPMRVPDRVRTLVSGHPELGLHAS